MPETTSPTLPAPETLVPLLRRDLPQFKQIEWVERTTSTNAELLNKARTNRQRLARPWLLGAHLQEQGRGRAGRTWQNRAGANLMFSCAFDVFLPIKLLPALSPVAGIAACEALRGFIKPPQRDNLTMKWPNDLQWKTGKLAGILVETTRAGTSRLSPDHHVVIIGIGINLDDARALSLALDRQVADWSEIARDNALLEDVPVATLVTTIAHTWYEALNTIMHSGFETFPARHAQIDTLAGQHVDVLDEGHIIDSGIACGINQFGQLLLRTPKGETPITIGEISVRL